MVEDVKKVIAKYVDGAYRGDVALLKSVFAEEAVLRGFKNDEYDVMTRESYLNRVANRPSMESLKHNFKTEIEFIRVTGNIATVILKETGFYAVYQYEDVFQLLKKDGEWKIYGKLFTTV
jgi:hypothetical protein